MYFITFALFPICETKVNWLVKCPVCWCSFAQRSWCKLLFAHTPKEVQEKDLPTGKEILFLFVVLWEGIFEMRRKRSLKIRILSCAWVVHVNFHCPFCGLQLFCLGVLPLNTFIENLLCGGHCVGHTSTISLIITASWKISPSLVQRKWGPGRSCTLS